MGLYMLGYAFHQQAPSSMSWYCHKQQWLAQNFVEVYCALEFYVLGWLILLKMGIGSNCYYLTSLPTFIIAECVLIYLDPDSTKAIVGWASKTFSTAVFFLYEQVFFHGLWFFPLLLWLNELTKRLNRYLQLYLFFFTDTSQWCFWRTNDKKSWGICIPFMHFVAILNSASYAYLMIFTDLLYTVRGTSYHHYNFCISIFAAAHPISYIWPLCFFFMNITLGRQLV